MKTLHFVAGADLTFGIPFLPVQLITTGVGGCLVGCTFGFLLIPLSILWLGCLSVLAGLSWLWLSAGRLGPIVGNVMRFVIAVVGVPATVLSATYVALIPSMGDFESRNTKLMLCWVWPYTWDALPGHELDEGPRLDDVLAALNVAAGRKQPTPMFFAGMLYGIAMLTVLALAIVRTLL